MQSLINDPSYLPMRPCQKKKKRKQQKAKRPMAMLSKLHRKRRRRRSRSGSDWRSDPSSSSSSSPIFSDNLISSLGYHGYSDNDDGGAYTDNEWLPSPHHRVMNVHNHVRVSYNTRRCRFLRKIHGGLRWLGSTYLQLLFLVAFQGAIISCTSSFDDFDDDDDEGEEEEEEEEEEIPLMRTIY